MHRHDTSKVSQERFACTRVIGPDSGAQQWYPETHTRHKDVYRVKQNDSGAQYPGLGTQTRHNWTDTRAQGKIGRAHV